MMRGLGTGTLVIALGAAVAGPLASGSATAASLLAPAWAISPEDGACRTDLELGARSGAVAPVTLVSDGERVSLRFALEAAPAQAFLPIRVDGRPYANLVQRTDEPGVATMDLSDQALAALRKGRMLQIAWLADEAMSGSLAGAAQGITDLRTCGAQVSAQRRSRLAEADARRIRALEESRAKAVADEQLATARARRLAAEAERQRIAAEANRASALAEQQRADALAQQARYAAEIDRRRAVAAQQAYYYYEERRPEPQPPPWGYYRPYYPR